MGNSPDRQRTAARSTNLPPLELRAGERRWILEPHRPYTIGRDGDIALEGDQISRRHAVLEPTAQGWVLADQSRNGTYLNGQRITQLALTAPATVVLGPPPDGVPLHIAPAPVSAVSAPTPAPVPPGRPGNVHQIRQPKITIGRLPDNDVVLDDLLVSRRHAELHRTAQGWQLVDLRSDNGSYVNGKRLAQAIVSPGDVIGIGHQQLHLVGDRLEAYVDTGDIGFAADNLVVTTEEGARILDGVSFALEERSLLAVVGPSGSGKSTLLNALTGFRPATEGQVIYGGRDLYTEYDELRNRIGLVPQEDILHSQLTVRRALSFSAKLRFPQDVNDSDRNHRVDEVLAELSLAQHAGKRITKLSGGQRKRTSVALELLTKPSLLFLDEPTSGLDPGMDKSVMQTLRRLADDGRTVVVVTHAMQNVNLCDRLLILARGGQPAYFGPPRGALEYFGQEDYAEIFLLLDQESNTDWGARFRSSPYFQQYVAGPAGRQRARLQPASRTPAQAHPGQPALRPPSAAPRQQSAFRQFTILCQRYLAVIAADRLFTIMLLALPVGLGLITLPIPGSSGLSVSAALAGATPADRSQPTYLLLLLVIAGLIMGTFQSIRELVKEREIYRRERAIGLSMTAYLCSKLAVLGVLVGLQGVLLGLIGTAWDDPPDEALILASPTAEVVFAITAVTLASMLIGLLISALVQNADRGMPLMALAVMLQIILSGGIFPVSSPGLEQASWLSPSRWAFAMAAATVNLNPLKPPSERDPLWDHEMSRWIGGLFVLVLLSAALTVGIWLLLRRFDPKRRSGITGGAPLVYQGPPRGSPRAH